MYRSLSKLQVPKHDLVRKASVLLCVLGVFTLGLTSANAQTNDPLPDTIDPNAPELAIAVVRDTGEEIPYDVIDGMAILEGDIILGTHDEVQAFGIDSLEFLPTVRCDEGVACSSINSSRSWPGGIVHYAFGAGTTAGSRQVINDAIAEWENKTAVRFVQRTNQAAYIDFVGTGPGGSCSSALGRTGRRQQIRYSNTGAFCMVHEIGHAVGLNHTQNRKDRDQFITIDFSNVRGNAASQFRIASTSNDVGPYDFTSVMHYGAFTFALSRSRPVIRPRDARIPLSRVGGTRLLSRTDVLGIASVYGNGGGGGGSDGGPTRSGNWVRCARENQRCNFSGLRQVGYGDGNNWSYRQARNGIDCNNRTFGDPIRGTVKSCFYRN